LAYVHPDTAGSRADLATGCAGHRQAHDSA